MLDGPADGATHLRLGAMAREPRSLLSIALGYAINPFCWRRCRRCAGTILYAGVRQQAAMRTHCGRWRMTDTPQTTKPNDPVAYLDQQVSRAIRGECVRDLGEAFSAVRARLERAEKVCRSLTLEPKPKLTGARKDAFEEWSSYYG